MGRHHDIVLQPDFCDMVPKRMSLKPITEHDIQKQILGWLRLKRIFHWRNNTGAMRGSHKGKNWFVRFGPKGAPDIIAIYEGLPVGIEVKRPGEGLSDAQMLFREDWLAAGGAYIVAMQLEDVTAVLEG